MRRRREQPIPRVNPSGRKVWVARYTGRDGKRRSAGTFARKHEAQEAIDRAYERLTSPATVGAYAAIWSRRHPRSERTNATNDHRVSRVLDVELEGARLRDWRLTDLRRRHAAELLDVLLRDQGRSARGARHVLSALALMVEDAIADELADQNPFRGVKVRATDSRVVKQPLAPRVWSFEQGRRFATAAAEARTGTTDELSKLDRWRTVYAEAMVRVFVDCGLRLGEALALERQDFDGQAFRVHQTAHDGRIQPGTKTTHGRAAGFRTVPCPASLALLIRRLPPTIGRSLMFPTPTGKVWRERNFYRDVWEPAREASGLSIRPHELRHSWVSHLRAAGVDEADLAEMAGHTVETMTSVYTHALGRSFERVRELVG